MRVVTMKNIIDKLRDEQNISDKELKELIEYTGNCDYLHSEADKVRRQNYGTDVYIRGLIEISNYCKNNCYYCGIRAGNTNVERYRLSYEDILHCCEIGYELGFRTFVMQGGEDPFFDDDTMCKIISAIRTKYPDCAITLSLGEKSYESYKAFFDAGANRYLLRHETADDIHYNKLHPETMKLSDRKKCLYNLKKIGFQTGAGFLVGSPYQTTENIISDFRFLQELQPEMIGIGPFLSHKDTPFAHFENGSAQQCIKFLSILRLMFPKVLLPSTTALGTALPDGREQGIKAGANVVMPNLSPTQYRKLYGLYDNKICTGNEAAECLLSLRESIGSIGYRVVIDRGDFAGMKQS